MTVPVSQIAALLVAFSVVAATAKLDVARLKCLVCEATLSELDEAISLLDPDVRTPVGGYSVDADGRTVALRRSEVALSEAADAVCERMDEYVRATWKSNGTLTLLRMVTAGGAMNAAMSAVDFVQDDDLNRSLKYYCEEVLEAHEEAIVARYAGGESGEEVRNGVCGEEYCGGGSAEAGVSVEKEEEEEDGREEL